jgi:proline iminopeptidase
MKTAYRVCSVLGVIVIVLVGCCGQGTDSASSEMPDCGYLDFRTPGEFQAGGVRMIELAEGYRVWTKRFGNGPIKVLLLHGGPAATHEYMEAFESFFPQVGIEFYHYDQLGSHYSDQPEDTALWTIERFVEEVEQVRIALGLDESNFFLLGNSWGGMLAMEYALKYQHNLRGLIVCNMTASFPKYEAYNSKLRAQLAPEVLEQLENYESAGDYHNEEYVSLVFEEYYRRHICRLEEWPEPVVRSFAHINQAIYEYMQGPSEFVPGGILKGWSVWDRLGELEVPTLMVGAKHDTMDPAEMEEMSTLVQNGRSLYCPNGSHLAMWDDQEVFMDGVIGFISEVHAGTFPTGAN